MPDQEQLDILLFNKILYEVYANINNLIINNPSIRQLYNKNTNDLVHKILLDNPLLTEQDGYACGLSISLFLLAKINN